MAEEAETMTAASRIIGRIPIRGARKNDEVPELKFLECSILKNAQGLSLFSDSITLKMQNSTACDWLAKACSLILAITQSKASGSTVTFRRFLRVPFGERGIQSQSLPNNLNMNQVIGQTSANNALGLSDNDKHTPNSGSPGRHRDDVVPQLGGGGPRARGQDHRGGLAPHGGQGDGRGLGGGGGRRGRHAGMPRGADA